MQRLVLLSLLSSLSILSAFCEASRAMIRFFFALIPFVQSYLIVSRFQGPTAEHDSLPHQRGIDPDDALKPNCHRLTVNVVFTAYFIYSYVHCTGQDV